MLVFTSRKERWRRGRMHRSFPSGYVMELIPAVLRVATRWGALQLLRKDQRSRPSPASVSVLSAAKEIGHSKRFHSFFASIKARLSWPSRSRPHWDPEAVVARTGSQESRRSRLRPQPYVHTPVLLGWARSREIAYSLRIKTRTREEILDEKILVRRARRNPREDCRTDRA